MCAFLNKFDLARDKICYMKGLLLGFVVLVLETELFALDFNRNLQEKVGLEYGNSKECTKVHSVELGTRSQGIQLEVIKVRSKDGREYERMVADFIPPNNFKLVENLPDVCAEKVFFSAKTNGRSSRPGGLSIRPNPPKSSAKAAGIAR